MNRLKKCAAALSLLLCVCASAEPPAWLENWYEIEVILFIQPDVPNQETVGSTPEIYTEDLVVAAPRVLENVKRAFPLNQEERILLRDRSATVDLSPGSNPWFRPLEQEPGGSEVDSNKESQFGRFPEWLLPPGESYHPIFFSTFDVVPFGEWFAALSVASLLDKDDSASEGEVDEDLASNRDLVEGTNNANEETQLTREEVLERIEAFRVELERSSYVMDEQNLRLPLTASRMKAKGVHVVKHFNWHQHLPSLETEPEYVFFQSLNDYPTEGYFGVSRGRFIHFDVHLWIHLPRSSSGIRYPVYELVELRRMQRDDVHYFDHPKFGILAEVAKVNLPPDLQALWESLD